MVVHLISSDQDSAVRKVSHIKMLELTEKSRFEVKGQRSEKQQIGPGGDDDAAFVPPLIN